MVQGKVMIAILLLVAVVGGIFLFSAVSKNPVKTAGVINNPDENSEQITENSGNVIEITSSEFAPETLTISKGETVTFINKDTEEHWPASAMHPTHTFYPGSDIAKCFDDETDKSTLFDSCSGLSEGESWSFTFNEVGSWGYHDHLNANLHGKIIVE